MPAEARSGSRRNKSLSYACLQSSASGLITTAADWKRPSEFRYAGAGTVIDAEDDLGLDSSDTVLRLDTYYRFNPRHRSCYEVAENSLLSNLITSTVRFSISIVGLDYHFSDTFSAGLGYNHVALDVDADGSDFKGALDWSYDGALFSVAYSFGSVG